MFDFEKLEIYKKAKTFNKETFSFINKNKSLDTTTKGQLRRASFSIMLNIAEGSGRFSKADREISSLLPEVLCLNVLRFLISFWRKI
jgi:hypothetical protein